MKTSNLAIALVIGMALPMTVSAAGGAEQGKGPIVLKLSHPSALTHPYNTAAEMFKKIVEEKTKGKYKIQIFPLNQLGSQEEVTEAAQLGTIDLVVTSDDKLMSLVPEFGALGMPFLFRDFDHVYKTLNGEVGELLSKKLEAKNIVVVSWLENGFRHITNNRGPINTPADLKGLKIRVSTSKPNMELFNDCGAAATNISFSELYSALQLKTVDAQENPFTNILDKKFYEVQKYLTVSGHVHTSEPMIMSKKSFDRLTPEEQKIFMEAGKEISKWSFENAKENSAAELQKLKDLGMQVNTIDQSLFAAETKQVYDKYGAQFKDLIDMIKKN